MVSRKVQPLYVCTEQLLPSLQDSEGLSREGDGAAEGHNQDPYQHFPFSLLRSTVHPPCPRGF